jgi:hypothetical protein
MRNLLALIGALVVGFAGVGWYMGWYKLSVSKNPEGHIQIRTDVHTDKVAEDVGKASQQIGSFIGEKLDKSGRDANAAQPGPVGATPGPLTQPTNATPPPQTSGWPFGLQPVSGGK